jgi:hypothetical protein
MTLPRSSDRYDVPAGTHIAVPGDGQVVYRRLAGAEPGTKDFRSDRDRGRPPAAREPWIEHAGLSVFDAAEAAVSVVTRFPVFIAELAVPTVAQPSSRHRRVRSRKRDQPHTSPCGERPRSSPLP